MTDFIRKPVREWLQELEDASSVHVLDPLTFQARRGTGLTGTITALQARQEILGHGQEFTLSMFGWVSGDIWAAASAAIAAAAAAGGGSVLLPAGLLTCSATLVVPNVTAGAFGSIAGVCLRGSAKGGTVITFPSSGDAITLTGFSHSLEHLLIYSAAGTGCGVRLLGTIQPTLRSVWVRGFSGSGGIGIRTEATGGGSNPCQDVYMSDVQVQACETGCDVQSINHGTFAHLQCNQNTGTGLHLVHAAGLTLVGGLYQGASPYMIHMQPAVNEDLQVDFVGMNYMEWAFSSGNAAIHIEAPTGGGSAGRIGIGGGFAVAGSATTANPVISITSGRLSLHGELYAPQWARHLKARTCTDVLVTNPSIDPTLYDLDATSAGVATWLGSAGVGVGTATAPGRGLVSRLVARDGSYWDQSDNFVQLISGILGYRLRACVHPAHGMKWFGAPDLSGIADNVTGVTLAATGASVATTPSYASDGSNFGGHPVIVSAGDGQLWFTATGMSHPAVKSGDLTPWILYKGRLSTLGAGACLFSASRASSGGVDCAVTDDGTHFVGHINGVSVTGPAHDTAQHVFLLTTDGSTTSSLWVDGVQYTTASGAAAPGDATSLTIGRNAVSGGDCYALHGVLIVSSGTPTAGELAAINTLVARDL